MHRHFGSTFGISLLGAVLLLVAGSSPREVVALEGNAIEMNGAMGDTLQGATQPMPRALLGVRALLQAPPEDDDEDVEEEENELDIDGEKVPLWSSHPDASSQGNGDHHGDLSGLALSHPDTSSNTEGSSKQKYLPRIYADTAFRKYFNDLEQKHSAESSESKSYMASRKKEREKAHAMSEKKYQEWHKGDQAKLAEMKKKRASQKEAERQQLEVMKDAETKTRGRPLQHTPGSYAPDTRELPSIHMDPATMQQWLKSLIDAGLKEVMDIMKNGTCAIVGNAGHLRLTEFGSSVDQHDVVIRLNAAPTVGYEKYVGTKTHVRVLNNALAKEMSDRVRKWPKDMWERMMEPGVSLWMRATDECTDDLRAALIKAGDHRPVVKMEHDFTYAAMPMMRQFYLEFLKQHSLMEVERSRPLAQRLHSLKELRVKHIEEGQFGKRGDELFGKPTTGLAVLYAIKDMCRAVTVYGVGTHDAKGNPTEYKYYKPDAKFIPAGNQYAGTVGSHTHSFEFEQELLIAMGNDKLVKYCVYDPENPAANLECRAA
mmetsp:Transcript_17576/g.38324  ORF Transcript_17576/g.38324 Transcript_17576/m.38324 type:complete len:543 (-) Transcript_17576:311-1939(-)|eukprot:CAMPEP_0118935642 /NCGR_PEP_ID=MMETSP1169-20130426/15753_1 /TAXON_ID=36882 /ORGANISM="Pyramimonas obovata, Strain CCMP722" /LENGTH=542 /DNA_ID=CAMNT_0006878701 /DNA_START=419 /DNA_END=2047 /DNA_ORIENTATION=-